MIFIWCAKAAFLGSFLPACSPPSGGGQQVSVNLNDQLEQGKTLYEQSCAQCHYDGAGSSTAPDLKGSAMLAQPPTALASLIIKGQSGVSMVNGKKFGGTMPAQDYLTDEEIAALVVYVRSEFGSRREALPPSDVAPLR